MDAFIIMKTKYLAQQNFNILRIFCEKLHIDEF